LLSIVFIGMRYIITESQFSRVEDNYLNAVFETVFNDEDLMYGPSEYEGETQNDVWEFYIQKKYGKEPIFTWYDDEKPILKIYGGIANELDEEYGEKWKNVFKEWFENTFGKQVEVLKY